MEDLLVASAAVASETPEGKVGLGGKCTEDSECAADLTCDPEDDTCTEAGHAPSFVRNALRATVLTLRKVPLGGDCRQGQDDCADSYVCDPEDDTCTVAGHAPSIVRNIFCGNSSHPPQGPARWRVQTRS